jgi:hypothetical protein
MGKKGSATHEHGFGHHYGPAPHLGSHSVHVWGLINGHWYQGEMTFYPGGNEVHLDASAAHIGSLTHQNFVVHDGSHWFNAHINHGADGAAHVYTTPIGHAPVPPWEEFLHPETLPPLPEIHLPFNDPTSQDYDTALSYSQSNNAYPGHDSAYPTYGAPYESQDSYAVPSIEDGSATWQG